MGSNRARRVFRVASLLLIAVAATGAALAILYSTHDLERIREPGLAGLLMLTLLPGATLGAVVLDRHARRRRGS